MASPALSITSSQPLPEGSDLGLYNPKPAISASRPLSIVDSQPLPAQGSAIARAGSAFWDGIGGPAVVNVVKALGGDENAAKQTMSSVKSTLDGLAGEPARVWSELSESGKAILAGHLADATYHLAGATPLVGAGAQRVAQDADQGDYATAAGHAAALILPFALGGAGNVDAVTDSVANIAKTAVAGVKAGGPQVAKGAAMLVGGEALSHAGGGFLPRIMLAYPGARAIWKGVQTGIEAGKAAMEAPEVEAAAEIPPVPIAPPGRRFGTGATPAANPAAKTVSAADQLAGELKAAAAPAEDTELLDAIAKFHDFKNFAAIKDPATRAMIRKLATGGFGEAPAAPAPTAISQEAIPPAPTAIYQEPAQPAAAPEISLSRAPQGGSPIRPPYGPRPTAEPSPAPAVPPAANGTQAPAAPGEPTPEEMASVFNPDKAAFEASQKAKSAAAEVKHMGARNAWAEEMANRLFSGGKGITPQDAQSLAELQPDGTYTVSPDLDKLARAKSPSKGPLPPASKMSAETILRMHQKLWDLWNDSLPKGSPPIGQSGIMTAH